MGDIVELAAARTRRSSGDYIECRLGDECIEIVIYKRGGVHTVFDMSPRGAAAFARGLLALAASARNESREP
jgi:hypothetical protein